MFEWFSTLNVYETNGKRGHCGKVQEGSLQEGTSRETAGQNPSHLLITYQDTANMPDTQVPLITQLHTNRAMT